VAVNAGSDAVEEVCAASRDPEMSEEGNPKVSEFNENIYAVHVS
jgi:hypothetical protein